MYGKPPHEAAGQLAALDAMVFFAAALVVSSVLLSYVEDSRVVTDEGPDRDPAEALSVFLRASLGSDVDLLEDGSILIRARDQAGECLLVELSGLSEGLPKETYDRLNEVLSQILSSICSPWCWRLSIFAESSELLILGCEHGLESDTILAGSTELEGPAGKEYFAVLSVSSSAC